MGTNQIQVNLKFNADVQQAKQSMLDLQNSLRSLTTTDLSKSMGSMGLTQEIQEATVKVTQLRTQLEAATNVNTGKLNLKTFNTQLKTSGNTLEQYKASLMALGPAGQQAFAQLARSVATAETPFISLGARMEKTFTTLANTARWQLASSVINGLSGAMQRAYGYAQDLNKSLTDIRIVSGYGADEMARFAEKANKAAKALSSTTTAYTNAALIYYQQGLSNAEVEERTATTIKMANVTGENAEAVSSYMTAIWNNFDDGSKSLEYYADVITALGAATAASSEEIAGGLEKFAAIGETIGLSYEYATAALTTIVAETRQSEDVVGTALKTIFARIQGLKLGESLEDGTDLNKYSAALASVGVNIKDSSGELKNMDTILDEVGNKWSSLARDEQMALAQTVAGVRQYTQFIALMDNYQDVFQENLNIANSAEGSLEEQQEIYAESWEGASKRAQAAMENIYQSLLNDEFFIKLTNMFAEMGEGLGEFLDNIGGAKTVLLLMGSIITQVFNQQIVAGITNAGNSIYHMTRKGKTELEQLKMAGFDMLKTLSNSEVVNNLYDQMAQNEQVVLDFKKKATEAEKQHADKILASNRALMDQAILARQKAEATQENSNTSFEKTKERAGNIVKKRIQAHNDSMEGALFDQDVTQSQVRASYLKDDYKTLIGQYQKGKQAAMSGGRDTTWDEQQIAMSETAKNILEGAKASGLNSDDIKLIEDFKSAVDKATGPSKELEEIFDRVRQNVNAAQEDANEFAERQKYLTEQGGLSNYNEVVHDTLGDDVKVNSLGETSTGDAWQIMGDSATSEEEIINKSQTLLQKLRDMTAAATEFNIIWNKVLGAGELDFGLEDEQAEFERLSQTAQQMQDEIARIAGEAGKENVSLVDYLGGNTEAQKLAEELKAKNTALPTDIGNMSDEEKTAALAALEEYKQKYTELVQMTEGKHFKPIDTNATINIEQAKKSVDGLARNLEKVKNTGRLEALEKTAPDVVKKFNTLSEKIKETQKLLNKGDLTGEELEKLQTELNNTVKEYEELGKVIKDLNNTNIDLEKKATNVIDEDAAKEAKANGEKVGKEYGDAVSKAAGTADPIDMEKMLGEGKKKIDNFAQGLTDMSSMLMSVATGIQALQSLGSIWNDEDLTVGEKLIQTMMSLSMIIPMVTTFTQNETMQTMANAISKKILTAATSANTVATGASTAAKGAETAAVTANTVAWYANPIMWIALIIIGVVAAVLLLVKGIQALSEALKSPEEKLNDMKNTLNEMSEATKRAQDELDNLKSSFDNFNSLQDPFKTLKKGTEEWTQAMYEANTAALEILKEHPELYGMEMNGEQAVTVEDGVYKIADWAQEQLLQAQMKEVMILQAVEAQKRYDVNKFELEVKQDELIDSLPKILSEELETRNLDSNKELKKYFEELALSDRRKGLNDQSLQKEIKDAVSKMDVDNPEQITEAILAGLSEYDLQNLEINNALDANTKALEANTLAMVSSLNSQYIKGYNNLSSYGQEAVDRYGVNLHNKLYNEAVAKEGTQEWTSYNSKASATGWGGFWEAVDVVDGVLNDTIDNFFSGEWDKFFKAEGWTNTIEAANNWGTARAEYAMSENLVKEYATAQGLKGDITAFRTWDNTVDYTTEDGTKYTWDKSDIYDWKAQTVAMDSYEDNINNDKVVNAIRYLDSSSLGQSILKLGSGQASDFTKEEVQYFVNQYMSKAGMSKQAQDYFFNQSLEEQAHEMGLSISLRPASLQRNKRNGTDEAKAENVDSIMWDTADQSTDSDYRKGKNDVGEVFFHPIVESIVNATGEDYKNSQDLIDVATAIWGTDNPTEIYHAIGQFFQDWDEEESEEVQKRKDEEAAKSYIDQSAGQYGFDPEVLKIQAEQLREVNSELELSAEQAAQLAVENARMNKGLETLVDNWDDWGKALKSSDKTTQDWAEAAAGCTDAIIDLVGASADLELPTSFFEDADNLALIEEAAKGSEDAINKLGIAVAQAQVEMMEWNNSMVTENLDGSFSSVSLDQFTTWKDTVLAGIADVQSNLSNIKIGDDIYEQLGGTDWVNALNSMAQATSMSVDQMQGLLNSMGVQADVTTIWQPQPVQVPVNETRTDVIEPGDPETGDGRVVRTSTHQVDMFEAEGGVMVAQINTGDDTGTPPKINFVGNGSVNPSSKNGSGGGGGGGGGSKKKKQDKKKTSDEKERYHVINKQLDMLSREYDKVSKAADRAFGPAKLKLLDQQIAKTKEQIKAEKEHLKQINNYLKTDKADMSKYGAEFDEDGVILNYDKLVEEQVAIYNKAVDAFNKSAQEEADDEALQKAEEAYEEFQEKMSQYEETVDLKFDTEQALKDLNYQLQDEELQALVVDIEYKISVNESQLEYLEFLLDRVDDNAFKAAESMGLLGQQTEIAFQNLDYYSNKLREMLLVEGGLTEAQYGQFMQGIDTVFEGTKFENNEALIEQAKEWRSAMIEENQNLFDIQEQVQEKVLEVFDAWTEKLDQQTSIVEHAASVLEHYKNIIDIVGQDRLGISDQLLSSLQDAQHEVQLNAIEQSRYAYEAAAQSLAEAEAAYKRALISGDEERIKYWEETVATMRETVDGYQEEMMSKLTDGLQQAADRFGTAIEKIGQKFKDEMARGYGTAEYMQRAYDRYNEENERYIEEYQKIYELSKLTRDIQKAIDESDNIKAKQELSKLQDQINQKLESGAKMSEYELSVLQAEFELKQAEIALEEAQNAKSQVRLSRDSEGNYGYVYTADQEQIDQATANYEEKLYNLQDVTQQYIEELTSETLALYGEYADEVMELNQMLAEGRITKEQYDQMLAETQEYYGKRLDYIGGQMQIALDNAAALYDSDHGHYYDYLLGDEGKKAFDEDYMQHFRDTFLGEMGLNYDSWHELELDFQLKSQKMLYDLGEAYRLFEQEVDESLNAAGLDMETFSIATRKAMDESIKASQDATKATKKMKTDMVKDMKEIIREVEIWQVKYSEAINTVIKDIESLLKKYKELEAAQQQNTQPEEKKEEPTKPAPTPSSGGNSTQGDGKVQVGDKVKLARDGITYYYDSYGSTPKGNRGKKGDTVEVQNVVNGGKGNSSQPYGVAVKSSNSAYGWLKIEDITGFDTGGYTGNWGAEGRLAMLHQKELVLNAKDTENMLSAVSIVRDILKEIDLRAVSAIVGATSLTPGITPAMAQTLEQDVTIHAEFPNVQDRNEIEEAFKTLVNEASQYANRKR